MMQILDFLFPPRSDELTLRSVSTNEFLALVAPRLVSETRPGTVALLPFPDPRVRAAIHEMKYHGHKKALEFLCSALVEYLQDAEELGKSVLVPIPLSPARQKERGFNQVEEVVRSAAKQLGRAVDSTVLVRTRETTSQVSLQRHAREENMRGAFLATRPLDPACTYLVIDDVITTGATLGAAIDALHAAGAKHIVPFALAH